MDMVISAVIPAQAGIQEMGRQKTLDSRFRGNDETN
jgi:hypothetical protein